MMLLALCICSLTFPQNITLFNRLGTIFLVKDAEENSEFNFGSLYNWIVGGYQGEKFSFHGRAQFTLESKSDWKDDIIFGIKTNNPQKQTKFLEFSGAFRPWDFFEIAIGNGYGSNDRMPMPWSSYQLSGGYGYATELSYGLRKWAYGNGLSFLLKGDALGFEGLTLGWNALPLSQIFKDGDVAWENSSMINYHIKDIVNLSMGSRLTMAKDASQIVGVYGELLAIKGFKANLGATIYTNNSSTVLGSADAMATYDKSFTTVLNTGLQYTIAPIKMTLAFDGTVLAGSKKLTGQYASYNSTSTPMLVGGMIRWVVSPLFTTILQVKYGNNLASKIDARESKLTITPRALFYVDKIGTLCLTPLITINEKNQTRNIGYNFSLYWQYNFAGGRRS